MTIKKPPKDQTAFINGATNVPIDYKESKEQTVQTSLRMPESNYLDLKAKAFERGTTVNSLINMVLKLYIDESI